jgi:hypothetical protein
VCRITSESEASAVTARPIGLPEILYQSDREYIPTLKALGGELRNLASPAYENLVGPGVSAVKAERERVHR